MRKHVFRYTLSLLWILWLLTAGVSAADGDVPLDSKHFPDELFRQHLSAVYDADGDGILTSAERSDVTELHLKRQNIESLQGIAFFPNLKVLDCSGNRLTKLELSQNTQLQTLIASMNILHKIDVSNLSKLQVLSVRSCELKELNISGNPELKELDCSWNWIERLDLSGKSKLEKLNCAYNYNLKFASPFSDCPALEFINSSCCFDIEKLDFSGNRKLRVLNAEGCPVKSLDISNCTQLEEFSVTIDQKQLDLSPHVELRKINLDMSYNLEELNLTGLIWLQELKCSSTGLTELDLSACKNLRVLECYFSKIKSLDLSACTSLEYLDCNCCELTALELAHLTFLNGADLPEDDLHGFVQYPEMLLQRSADRTIDLSRQMKNLSLSRVHKWYGASLKGNILTVEDEQFSYDYDTGSTYEPLRYMRVVIDTEYSASETAVGKQTADFEQELDLTQKSAEKSIENQTSKKKGIPIDAEYIQDIYLREYLKQSADVNRDGYLSETECAQVTEIDLSNLWVQRLDGIEYFTNLEKLDCSYTQIASLSLPDNSMLQTLDCSGNPFLMEIDLSGNRMLENLYMENTGESYPDFSNNKNLRVLICYDILQLEEGRMLDLSQNEQLEVLDCSQCIEARSHTVPDWSANHKLRVLICRGLGLNSLDISENRLLEELDCSENNLYQLDLMEYKNLKRCRADGNTYKTVITTENTYALSNLPEPFDVSRTKNWKGGRVENGIVIFEADSVTYEYLVGKVNGAEKYVEFCLIRDCRHEKMETIVHKKASTKQCGEVSDYCPVCGYTSESYQIEKIKTVKISKTVYAYNGEVRKPSVSVYTEWDQKLTKGKDYSVSYSKGRKKVGTYQVTVKMKGRYTGTLKKTFKIIPPATAFKALKAYEKAVKLTWKKKSSQIDGYQIQYARKKDFKDYKKKMYKDPSCTSAKISGLKSGKSYYFRIRTYKKVGDKTYYSKWSEIKKKTTK